MTRYVLRATVVMISVGLGWRAWPLMQMNTTHVELLAAAMNQTAAVLPEVGEPLTGFMARTSAALDPYHEEAWLEAGLSDSSRPLTYWSLCNVYWRQQRISQAVEACQQAPSSVYYWLDLGLEAEATADKNASIAYYKMAAQIDPDSGEAHYRLGWRYLAEQQYEEAIASLSQAVAFNWPQAYILLAQAYYENHQYPEARQVLLTGVKAGPNRGAYIYLALVAEAEQEWAEADHWYEQLALLTPGDDRGWLGRGRIAILQTQYDLAVTYLQRATEIQPEKASNWAELGNAAALNNDISTATAAYQQALHLNPDRSYIWIQAGDFFRQQNQIAEARQAFQQALVLEPDNQQAQERLDRLNQP